MNIFLLWRERASARERIDPGDVARRLRGVLSPYFDELPAAGSRALPASRLVSLDLPVGGFTPAAHGVDDGGWAYAPQCPIDATRALASIGVSAAGDAVLPALGRALEAQPLRMLRELAPPFSLIWAAGGGSSAMVQTDGLGHATLYEYRDATTWAARRLPVQA